LTRLSNRLLSGLPADIARPAYDRATLTPGIVHLGLGAFHRAHMAAYIDDLLGGDPAALWGIIGVSLKRPDTRDALGPQDGLYTLVLNGAGGSEYRVIGSIMDVLVAGEDPKRLVDLMASEAVRIVSLTVTEKGYCHDPATGRLDETHPDIIADLANPDAPVSAPGFIVAALARRKAAGLKPFTVLSCDNLPENGKTARTIICALAGLRDRELGVWIEREGAFPATMVDRIVPATTDADRARVAKALGVADAWPVMAEPFTQWVIEDNFPLGRPDFAAAGAQMVEHVAPYENMKLRMLNGCHSSLAYLGYLAGYETVAEAMGNPDMASFLRRMMTTEIIPTLSRPGMGLDSVDLPAYRDALLARFANPALKHRTWQIAMDGSQKLPQRLLDTMRDQLAVGGEIDCLGLGVAGWMRYATGMDEKGGAIDVRDPMAARLRAIGEKAAGDGARLVAEMVALSEIFGTDLKKNQRFVSVLVEKVDLLINKGARAALATEQAL